MLTYQRRSRRRGQSSNRIAMQPDLIFKPLIRENYNETLPQM